MPNSMSVFKTLYDIMVEILVPHRVVKRYSRKTHHESVNFCDAMRDASVLRYQCFRCVYPIPGKRKLEQSSNGYGSILINIRPCLGVKTNY